MTTLLRLPAVMQRTGQTKNALYRAIAQGKFPRPVRIGLRAVAWPDTVIEEWIREKIAASERRSA